MKITQEGQPCRKCGTPVVKVVPKKRDPNKAYWFNYYLKCENCGTMYILEEQKVLNTEKEQMMSRDIPSSSMLGKNYMIFQKFVQSIQQKEAMLIVGMDYVVMSRDHYEKIINTQKK